MYKVTVRMSYSWEPQIPEDEVVWFILSGEYPCNSAEEAREVVLRLISLGGSGEVGDDEPGWVLDADGPAWPFYPDTVAAMSVEEVGPT